ncbi:3-oxoacyl-ACP synthase [Brevibacillus ruminantium]|uniref:3-oxoacyl-ACP synthase n=1 Tax=Brevibacillus ruminantium TaxID=2950604 RepID=A0ABY4WDK3_9BACL|nr:3-oxoacyl-ACP synthase [Brevibacillus ruminantium]USG64208.1 3-oxoacyl-ACP synthase [Brevibacillus ruminantium]
MTLAKNVGIVDTGMFFPPQVQTASQMAEQTGIPEEAIIEKFGLVKKHVSDHDLHASDMAVRAALPILEKVDRNDIDVVIYFGSPYKDYQVWSCAPKIQHELGLNNAYAFEMMNVSSCFPIALKVAKDMLVSDDFIRNVLLVGGCKESHLIDYENTRSRFMFNFADGGAAALVQRGAQTSRILASAIMTDGSFHDDVKVPAGGSRMPASTLTLQERLHSIDVKDPASMKSRLDPVSVPNFVQVVKTAVARSGYTLADIDCLLPLHTKRSMFEELLAQLGLQEEQAIYLDEYGHMSALDPCIGLHLARERGMLQDGSLAVALSAGTGYTWAATVIEWGSGAK